MSKRRRRLIKDLQKTGRHFEIATIAAQEIASLESQLQHLVDCVAPTVKSEFRLSQSLASALSQSKSELKR